MVTLELREMTARQPYLKPTARPLCHPVAVPVDATGCHSWAVFTCRVFLRKMLTYAGYFFYTFFPCAGIAFKKGVGVNVCEFVCMCVCMCVSIYACL